MTGARTPIEKLAPIFTERAKRKRGKGRGKVDAAAARRIMAGRKSAEVVEAWLATGSYAGAAEILGMREMAVARRIQRLRAAGAIVTPEDHDPESPFVVKGVSTLRDSEGKVRLRWGKTSLDQDKLAVLNKAALAAAMERIAPISPIDYAPANRARGELATVYTITDAHVGMYASQPETGGRWDMHIAERVIWGALRHLIDASPPARTGVVAQLGDFLHFDGLLPITPTSGHVLDAAARYPQLVRLAFRILRRSVEFALARHPRVVLVVAEGNHDLAGSIWLREMMAALYADQRRLTVLAGDAPWHAWRHGRTMLGWHHGHLVKPKDLPALFADAYAEIWGATRHRYFHCGHRHHADEKQHRGATVVQHPALAGNDAHAARLGFDNRPRASAITYHAQFGYRGALSSTPEMAVGPNWRSAA